MNHVVENLMGLGFVVEHFRLRGLVYNEMMLTRGRANAL